MILSFRCRHLVVLALNAVLLAACASASDSTPGEGESKSESAASALSSSVWVLEEYQNSCADQCGAPNCNCITNRCSASLAGQACAPVGASCNVVSGNYWREMICEQSSSPQHTWTRVSTESCLDICGVTNCNCVKNRCAGNPEGQACSNVNATCNVVSRTSYAELSCQ
jgi:hypothetical protein